MLTYHGGARVRSGFYWDCSRWALLTLPKEGGVLPGGETHGYLKVPVPLLLVLAPLMGGFYVLFLPFIGFAMVLGLAAKRTAGVIAGALAALMATLAPAWQPGEAYFAEKRGEKPEDGTVGESERTAAK